MTCPRQIASRRERGSPVGWPATEVQADHLPLDEPDFVELREHLAAQEVVAIGRMID